MQPLSQYITRNKLTVRAQRLKEMKQMSRDPLATSKARKAERKADEKSGLITIKPVKLDAPPVNAAAGGGFKKGGFKSAFGDMEEEEKKVPKVEGGFKKALVEEEIVKMDKDTHVESDSEVEGYEYYNPRHPTDCGPTCKSR